MKRKVRIYKDPNGMGGYINKTAQWLNKAAVGMQTESTPVTQGIMRQMQTSQPRQTMQQPQQDPQEQILQTVVALAQQGMGQEEIKDYLLQNVYGFDKNSQEYAQYEPQVLDFVSAVFERSGSEEEDNEQTYPADVTDMEETDTENVAENNNYGDEELMNDILFDDDEEEDQEARYGGVPNKRSYVNKLVRKLKKAAEGDQVEEANTANVRGTENNPTGTTGNKNTFIAGVKGQAENHFLKQQAEQMYNNQFSQGMPQPQANMDYAQFGGMRMRRANRKLFGTPFTPPGVTSSKYSFGPLGGVRSAEVQFNPLVMGSIMGFPMMGASGAWGYNQPYKKTSAGRLVTERISNAVNKESIKDVAGATGSEAANNAVGPCTEAEVKDPNNKRCYDPMYAGAGPIATDQSSVQGDPNTGGTGSGPTPGGTSNTGPFEVNGARQAMELKNKKDKWGRSPNDKWYGFDPDTKQWTKGKPDWKLEEEKKTVKLKKDKWGRPETSQWYGFDPKTKKYTIGKDKGLTAKQKETKNIKEMQNSPEVKKLREFYSKPQAAQADDELITAITLGGANQIAKKLAQKAFYGFKDNETTPESRQAARAETQRGGNKVYKDYWKSARKSDRAIESSSKGPKETNNKQYKDYWKSIKNSKKSLDSPKGQKSTPDPLSEEDIQLLKNMRAERAIENYQFENIPRSIALYEDFIQKLIAQNPNFFKNKLEKKQTKKKSFGGPVNNPMQDQFGNLQKFIYGDQVDDQLLENLYQPPINQSDLDDSDSKDVTDAYFMHGGLHKAQYGYGMMSPYGYGYRGAPMGGFGGYGGPGLLGSIGRLAGSFGGRQSQFTPVGNPLQYAATAAGITQSGMLPTGMKYSKEKAAGLLGKLGLKHDKTWTIDYATPEQIKAGIKPGAIPGAVPGIAGSQQGKSGAGLRDAGMNLRERFLNRNTPAEADAEAFTSTLTGSTEPQGPSKSAQDELARFEANQRRQGLTIDPRTQKWVKTSSLINDPNAARTPGLSPSQGADVVTGTPGTSVGTLPSQGGMSSQGATFTPGSTVAPGTSINGMVESPGMVGKTPEEIKEAYRKGTSIPTVVNKGNTTYINAAGEPIDLNDPVYSDTYAYGGYVPDYMAYGGYIPEAYKGIDFSSVSYDPNSIVQPGGIGQGKTGPCTEEEVKDPNSPCYDPIYAGQGPRVKETPQTAQLKFTEKKQPMSAQQMANIAGSALDTGALLADQKDYLNERKNKYIPGMTEFAMGEKQSANERINKGEWNARTGKEGIQGFEGVIRKGGAIKSKKSNASGHKIDMNDFQSLLKIAGLI